MQKERSRNSAGRESPISLPEEDRYGFVNVAAALASSILTLDNDVSTVIGIEGKWGAGKTSLLRLLLKSLDKQKEADTHILHIAPWMTAQGTSPADSLLLPVAAILREVQDSRRPAPRGVWQRLSRFIQSKRNTGAALDMLNFLQQTSGRLAPLADFAGNFVKGMDVAAKGMETLARLDLSGRRQTAAALHASLDEEIRRLDLNFIVVVDDLDRLEPAQAVEVLRLIRSVADFSRFRYVICYDRNVLAQAVEQHLHVSDGAFYLQKIIQLPFCLPRPETFDLRREFRTRAAELYEEINGYDLNADAGSELADAVDAYGEMLSTPREVNQTLNALRFIYPGLKDYVYFPDLCFLQLLRVVNPGLYGWAEHYLTERAVIETNDASIRDGQKKVMSDQLKMHMSRFPDSRARYGWNLGRWLPGISGYSNGEYHIFQQIQNSELLSSHRRLGSLIYWRYYFSFSAPQNVLPEEKIQGILHMAGTDVEALEKFLIDNVSSNGISSRTWFEHIITRLTPRITGAASYEQQMGLISFFFNNSDRLKEMFMERHSFFIMYDSGADNLVRQLMSQALENDRSRSLSDMKHLFGGGRAVLWAAGFMRDLLCLHGLAGTRTVNENERFLNKPELEDLRDGFVQRLNSDAFRASLFCHSRLLGYLNAWREIEGEETVRRWTHEVSSTDAQFLQLLLKLRIAVTSSDRGNFLKLDLSAVSNVFLDEENIKTRLKKIEETGCYDNEIREIRDALKLTSHW